MRILSLVLVIVLLGEVEIALGHTRMLVFRMVIAVILVLPFPMGILASFTLALISVFVFVAML